MICRTLAFVALVMPGIACGDFREHPEDALTIQLTSPVEGPVMDFTTGNQPSPGCAEGVVEPDCPEVTCSVADPVVALRVRVAGCDDWQLSMTSGWLGLAHLRTPLSGWSVVRTDAGTAVATASMASALPAGDLSALEPVTSCAGTETGSPFFLRYPGLAVRYDDPWWDSVVAPSGKIIFATSSAIGTPDGGSTPVAGLSPHVYVLDQDVVVSERCTELWCRGNPLIHVVLPGGDLSHPVLEATNAELVGSLRPSRLVFLAPATGTGPADSVLVTDGSFGNPHVLPLGSLRFATTVLTRGQLGHTVGGTFTFVGSAWDFSSPFSPPRLVRLSVDAATETLSVADLGPSTSDYIYLAPDASYVAMRTADLNGWVARNLADGQVRWTLEGHRNAEPIFLGAEVLFGDTEVAGVDAQTGALRWSVPLAGQYATQLAVSDDALVVNTNLIANGNIEKQGVVVVAPDHTIRFAQWGLPAGGPLLSDGQGHLVSSSLSVTLADAALHAPPPSACARVDCGAGVVDLGSDPANCGGCGVSCSTGTCRFGACM